MSQQLLIFTDMDGSLLDHYSYSFAPAEPMLERLRQNNIPVIPTTSKTRSELLELRRSLNNNHPFISENGAAVFIPVGYFEQMPAGCELKEGYWVKSFCAPRQHWLDLLLNHWADFSSNFTTFAESGIDEIAAMTGLNPDEAKRASLREYGEPIKWQGDEKALKKFIKTLERAGAYLQNGGRFLHVSGKVDKGNALRWLTRQYQRQLPEADCYTIGIGDSQNDCAMLEAADHALIIRSPVHAPPELNRSNALVISEKLGPEGWAEGLEIILSDTHRQVDHG